jgi:hypothetical protein
MGFVCWKVTEMVVLNLSSIADLQMFDRKFVVKPAYLGSMLVCSKRGWEHLIFGETQRTCTRFDSHRTGKICPKCPNLPRFKAQTCDVSSNMAITGAKTDTFW